LFRREKKLKNIHEIREALAKVQIWRKDPSQEIFCPICDAPGFSIVDRSARPYAEWFAVKCEKCGIDDAISVPLCPQMIGGN
jgi:hypothetical protein